MSDDPLEDDDESKDRFFRERRMLLGVSVVLLAHQLLNITIERSVESLGLRFELENPERLWMGVWLIWLWTLGCYLQRLSALKISESYPDIEQQLWQRRFCRLMARRVIRRVAKKGMREIPADLRRGFEVTGGGRPVGVRPYGGVEKDFEFTVIRKYSKTGERLSLPRLKIAELMKSVGDGFELAADGSGVTRHHETLVVQREYFRNWRSPRLAAFLVVLVTSSYFTDYFAPVVVGVAPLFVLLYKLIAAVPTAGPGIWV